MRHQIIPYWSSDRLLTLNRIPHFDKSQSNRFNKVERVDSSASFVVWILRIVSVSLFYWLVLGEPRMTVYELCSHLPQSCIYANEQLVPWRRWGCTIQACISNVLISMQNYWPAWRQLVLHGSSQDIKGHWVTGSWVPVCTLTVYIYWSLTTN